MKKLLAIAFIASLITSSCKEQMETNVSTNDQKPDLETDVQFVNQAHQLVYDMVQNVGNYNQLLENKTLFTLILTKRLMVRQTSQQKCINFKANFLMVPIKNMNVLSLI